MKVLRGFAPDGSRAWSDDKGMQAAFWEDVKSTSAWSRYVQGYGNSDSNNAIILTTLETLYGETDEFSANQFVDSLLCAMDSGAIKKRKPAEPIEPAAAPASVPTDRNGRPLSQSQIAFGEMTRWSQTATTAQVDERKRKDPAYLRFVQSSLRKEMDQGVGDSVMSQNPHLEQQAPPTKSALNNSEIIEFVKRYTSMSSNECRAARSKAQNPFGFQKFIDQTEEAMRCDCYKEK
jgi:hypothetical protein